jgi:hypothetical protein
MSTCDIGAGRGHRAGSGPVADRPATGATWPASAAGGAAARRRDPAARAG